jgi:glycosyltransferase involved in cell wall biosynthesis
MTGAADNRARAPAGEAPVRVGMLVNGGTYAYGVSEVARLILESLDRRRVRVAGLFLARGEEHDILGPLCDEVCDLDVGSLVPLTAVGHGRYYLPNLARKGLGLVRAVLRTAAAARRLDLDLIHVHFFPLHLVAGLAARLAGKPCLWHWHGPFQQGGVARLAARVGFGCLADHVACISRFVLETLPPQVQQRASVVYNGVDTGRIAGGQQHGVLRRRIGVPEGTPLVGLVGAIMERKGHEYFIRAAARVVQRSPDVRFVIVGTENEACRLRYGLEARYRRLAGELGLARSVIFAGHIPDASLLMADCDIICMPTIPMGRDSGEGFGLVMAEAMAAGVPVVATACGAALEIIEPRATGLLVPPRDSDALADAILFLLEDKERRRVFAQAAHRRIEEHFDIRHAARTLEDVYRAVTRGQ